MVAGVLATLKNLSPFRSTFNRFFADINNTAKFFTNFMRHW
jgi:hypothetical protein